METFEKLLRDEAVIDQVMMMMMIMVVVMIHALCCMVGIFEMMLLFDGHFLVTMA